MEKMLIQTKENKLNIFQKIRIEIFKRNMNKSNFEFQKYLNAPVYIKRDDRVVDILINKLRYELVDMQQTEKEKIYLEIPQDILLDKIEKLFVDINDFSIENQIKFAKKNPGLIWGENVIKIVQAAIERKQYDFMKLYPEYQDKILANMNKEEALDFNLPNIIKYLKNSEPYIRQRPELLSKLDIEAQLKYVYRDRKYLQYVSEDKQLEFIKKYEEYIQFANDKVSEEFVKINENNLAKTNLNFQCRMVQKYPKAYKFISEVAEKEIWTNFNNSESARAAIKLIENDKTYSKKFIEYGFKILKGELDDNLNKGSVFERELKDYLENCDAKETRDFFEKSKILSSHGTLFYISLTLHGGIGSEKICEGREGYDKIQRRTIRNLRCNQIKELISLDSNYILPYLGTEDQKVFRMWKLTDEGKKDSYNKCNELLKEIYDEDIATQLEGCVKIIYNQDMEERTETNYSNDKKSLEIRMNSEKNYTNHFKILFNKNIIENNSIEDIKAYFEQVKNNKEPTEEFYKLMQNAYGDKAVETLKSRPGLNVHTIKSLEDFDSRISDNFGEAFVHSLLNYNIRDHQEFMGIIKDERKLENFKTYYEILSNVMGSNVETIQRAISEYNYFDELLKNVKDVELTDKQYTNLISVLCSRDNKFNINTLNELQYYEEISSRVIKDKIEKAKGNTKEIKDIISGDLLGFRIEDSAVRDYGDYLESITDLYNIYQEKEENSQMYSEDEIKMLDCLSFIEKEENPDKLTELALNLLNEKNIQNPIIMHNAVEKIKENQTELFNSTLLTVEKMEDLCNQEEGKENPKIIKELTEEGLTTYILKGVDFKFMAHNSGGMHLKDLMQYEGHLGTNNICARLISQDSIILQYGNLDFIYTSIKESGGIQAYNNYDANTDHVPRRIHGIGGKRRKISYDIIKNNSNKGLTNEIAQNRNLKKLEDINNKNMGGKNLPDAYYGGEGGSIQLNKEDIEIMKKYNIPIIKIDREAYIKLAQQSQEKTNKTEKIEER